MKAGVPDEVIAQLAGVTTWQVTRWRRAVGISRPMGPRTAAQRLSAFSELLLAREPRELSDTSPAPASASELSAVDRVAEVVGLRAGTLTAGPVRSADARFVVAVAERLGVGR